MKQYRIIIPILLLVSLLIAPITTAGAQASSVVRAVLFYSPTCGHCHYVISETILPLMEKYGNQLQIIGLDVTQSYEQSLYLSALQKFNLDQGGVPFLVIDNMYLAGSLDIPEKFPGLVETYLAQGGVDWPDIPGLHEIISQYSEHVSTPTATTPVQSETLQAAPLPAAIIPTSAAPIATPGLITPDAPDSDWTDIFARDPAGSTLAVLVLMGMLATVVWTVTLFQRTNGISIRGDWAWIIPFLCVVGFGVAGYLAYVETAHVTAVCGPVGDCNTVQQSEYARLFGILPIGVLGLFGYAAIVIAWLIARNTYGRLADLAVLSLFIMTVLGTLFSIYLTFLEPFVIGATCAWCLTSSALMTVLMLLTAGPAKLAFSRNPFSSALHRRHSRIRGYDD